MQGLDELLVTPGLLPCKSFPLVYDMFLYPDDNEEGSNSCFYFPFGHRFYLIHWSSPFIRKNKH